MKTKKIRFWAAVDQHGKVGTGDKRAEALAALSVTSPKFDTKATIYTVQKFEHEIEVPEAKAKKAKPSKNGAKPKAKAKKKVAKKAKAKKKVARKQKKREPEPAGMPW